MAAAPAPAAGAGKGKPKRPLSEDDVYLLLHRYAPGTILTALQEVAQHAEGRRIDWRKVVAKSTTGITSAREYQMLWRHFAYNHDLDETVDAGEQPLGDDSDLELEPEPVPNPTMEALSEASALAKALISGSSREQASGQRVNLDAPLLNAPNEKIVRVPSEKQLAQSHRITNVTGPISNSKQASHLGPSAGSSDPNGHSKKKKKPKPWSKEEDADLATGVQKYGEGNWEDILHKCNFDTTRTPDQLSQRWALICKRPGGSTKPGSTKHITVASSEERKDALKAFSMAVGPIRRSSTLRPGAHQQGIQHKSIVIAPKIPEVRSSAAPSPALALPAPAPVPAPMPLPVKVQVKPQLPQGQQAPVQGAPPKLANASNKTRKKQVAQPNPTIGPSSLHAAAIAAGGRIAPASAAADFLKVAHSKQNAVRHIRYQASGSSKSSPKSSSVAVEPGTQPGSAQQDLNTSDPKSGPSVLTTHATEQVHGASEVAIVNPPGPSAGSFSLETKKALSITPVPISCDSEENEDDSTFCVITIEDLFPEDAKQPETVDLKAKQPVEIVSRRAKQPETVEPKAKQPEIADPKAKQQETADPKAKQPETADAKAKQPDTLNPKVEVVDSKDKDMLEFDEFVASQGAGLNTDHLDKSKTGESASQAQGLVGSQKQQVKMVPTVGKGNPVPAGAPATGKRTKTPAPHLVNPVPVGTPRGIVGTVNANALNKTLVRKAATPVPADVQAPLLKKHAMNTKGNQVMQPSTAVVGFGTPVSSQASVAMTVNGASKVNTPSSSSQVSAVVNTGSKANPPSSSGQASTVVNTGSKANLPSSSQATTVAVNGASRAANPPSSSQVSAAVSGATSKGNPPAAPKQ